MNPSDLGSALTLNAVVDIAAKTAAITGSTALDVRGYKGHLLCTQQVGVVSGTNPTWDGKFQESADGSTDWTDITGATFAQVTATGAEEIISFDVRETRGYVRYVAAIGGTSTPTFNVGVMLMGQKERV